MKSLRKNVSIFSIFCVGISNSWHAFVWPRLLLSLRIFSLSTISKENKSFELENLLIAFILGPFLYLTIAFRIVSKIFPEMSSQSWYSGTFDISYYIRANILLVDKNLSKKNWVNVFQNFLLSVIFFWTKRHNNAIVSNTFSYFLWTYFVGKYGRVLTYSLLPWAIPYS